MEDIDGGLHPAVDGQSLDEDKDEALSSSSLEWYPSPLLAFLSSSVLLSVRQKVLVSHLESCQNNIAVKTVICQGEFGCVCLQFYSVAETGFVLFHLK